MRKILTLLKKSKIIRKKANTIEIKNKNPKKPFFFS